MQLTLELFHGIWGDWSTIWNIYDSLARNLLPKVFRQAVVGNAYPGLEHARMHDNMRKSLSPHQAQLDIAFVNDTRLRSPSPSTMDTCASHSSAFFSEL
jgi:hypothetical protein